MENIQLHCDSFVFSLKTENITQDLKNLEDICDFSNLDENHELFSNINNEVTGKFKIETPKIVWIDEFICLRANVFSFKCNDNNENRNKLEGISKSQTKYIKFEEYKVCLDGDGNINEGDNYILKSINHDMYLQKTRKATLSIFDDKNIYLHNF